MGCTTSTVAPQRSFTASRDLGGIEHAYRFLTPDHTISHWFQVSGPVDEKSLAAALRRVWLRHINLQVILQDGRLVLPETLLEPEILIDLDYPVTVESVAKYADAEITRGLGATISEVEGRPLWRAAVLSDGWVVLTVNHMVADGRSLVLLMRHLLEELAGVAPTEPKRDWDMLVGLDAFIPENKNTIKGFNAIGELLKLDFRSGPSGKVPCKEGFEWPAPEATAHHSQRRCQSNVVAIDGVDSLLKSCRSHGCTLTALIVAALSISIRKRMKGSGTKMMKPRLTIDARKAFKDSDVKEAFGADVALDKLFGNYSVSSKTFGGLKVANEGKHSKLWDVAQQASDDMGRMASSKMVHKGMEDQSIGMGLMGREGERSGNFLKTAVDTDGVNQGRVSGGILANIGNAKDMAVGDYAIAQTFLNVNETLFGHFAFVSSCSIGNKLFLTLGTIAPFISTNGAQEMMDEIVSLLQDAMREGDAKSAEVCTSKTLLTSKTPIGKHNISPRKLSL